MKTIVFYGRTQMGATVLSYLVAKGYQVKVIPEDDLIKELCKYYNLSIVDLDSMGEFDLFISCHGEKIIPAKYLQAGKFVNMHPCLWKYKGKDPISRYIANKDTKASIEAHHMTEKVDEGVAITRILFETPIVQTHGEYYNLALPHYLECIDQTLRKIGNTAAFTRIENDEVKLELWLSYYSRYFDDLYVVGCLSDKDFNRLTEKYEFTFLPTEDQIHSLASLTTIKKKQTELLKDHEWVLYSDADEFVAADPEKYKDLKDFMLKSNEQQTFCEGYEVYRSGEEPEIDYSKPILTQRSVWIKDENGSYNKPLLSRVETKWRHGFHSIESMKDFEAKEIRDTGLYLIHLKHVNDQVAGDIKTQPIPENIRKAF